MVLTESEIFTRLIMAAFIGAIIGAERQIHKRPAGMRTHGLICVGATLFTIISGFYDQDPARISAGIVTGIGFLAAGVVFRSEKHLQGITTAAEIWVLAAIGIAIGAGLYYAAIATAIIVLVLLVPGVSLEQDVEKIAEKKNALIDMGRKRIDKTVVRKKQQAD